jgi:Flp pilus assembly pilin Flp
MRTLLAFCADDRGLELVEYAVMAAVVVAALVLAIVALGGAIRDSFGDLETSIDGLD